NPARMRVFVLRLLIKRKRRLPLAAGAAAAASILILAAGAAAKPSPRVSLADAAPAALTPLQRPAAEFAALIHSVAAEIRADERTRARRAARERRERYRQLPGGVSMATLAAIAACESGGDPTAVSADGAYHGKYQFDLGTWESVGGRGDPAAAPEREQ